MSMGPIQEPNIWECAALSSDVYKNKGAALGWTRIMQKAAGDTGFYGAAYSRGANVIIALRGTSDAEDAIDDLNMVPSLDGAAAEAAIRKLVEEYCKNSPSRAGINNAGVIAKKIFSTTAAQRGAAVWGNRVPTNQVILAKSFSLQVNNYCRAHQLRLRCFVGHSLGGALAQYLSEQTGNGGEAGIAQGIPAVAFNSPNMGSIAGMRKGAGGGILIVNARLDPLSFLTRLVGNESHAQNSNCEFSLELSSFQPPPTIPDQPTIPQWMTFNKWLGRAMAYYHSIDNMQSALATADPGPRPLRSFFPHNN